MIQSIRDASALHRDDGVTGSLRRDIPADIWSVAMKMQVGRWGNSLAVRLPKALTDQFNIAEGDELDSAAIEAALAAVAGEALQRRRAAALKRMEEARWPLPADWKFDREDAHWRSALDAW